MSGLPQNFSLRGAPPPDWLYYNKSVRNNGRRAIEAQFDDSRSAPLIRDVSTTHCAVVRLSMEVGAALPQFLCRVQFPTPDGATDVNTSIFGFHLTAGWNGQVGALAAEVTIDATNDTFYVNLIDGTGAVYERNIQVQFAHGGYTPSDLAAVVASEVAAAVPALTGFTGDANAASKAFFFQTAPTSDASAFTLQFDFSAPSAVVQATAQALGAIPGTKINVLPGVAGGANGAPTTFPNAIGADNVMNSPTFAVEAFMKWVPEDATVVVPALSGLTEATTVGNPYYYSYSMFHVTSLFNTAFARALDDSSYQTDGLPTTASLAGLFAAWWTSTEGANQPLSTWPGFRSAPPLLQYSATDGLFRIYFDPYGWGTRPSSTSLVSPSGAEFFTLEFDEDTYGLFSTFNTTFIDDDMLRPGEPLYVLNLEGALPATNPATGAAAIVIVQNSISTDQNWAVVETIALVCNGEMPMTNEAVSPQTVFGQTADLASNFATTTEAVLPILTDTKQALQRATDIRQLQYYAPQAEYRWFDMGSSRTALSRLVFRVMFLNKWSGTYTPVMLPPGCAMNIKIAFKHVKD